MAARRGFGKVRKLPSGRWQASYIGPDGERHNAAETFLTKTDAAGWLAAKQTDIGRETWGKPAPAARAAVPYFADYAARVITHGPLTGCGRTLSASTGAC